MSAPDCFNVSYCINPWMQPDAWQANAAQLAADARQGWQQLKACYEKLGAQVFVKPSAEGVPDLVFTANSAVVLDGKVLLARYLHPQRRAEEALDLAWFRRLQQQGFVTSLHHPPEDIVFEGAGDALWDTRRGVMWLGYGQRSSDAVQDVVRALYQIPTLSLQLVSPYFYHLDTCFCLLSGGEIIYWPAAFHADSQRLLQDTVGDALIVASEADAQHLGVNSVCIGQDVVMCYCSAELRSVLEARGYRVHVIDLGAFNRSGGSAYCLTLRLDQRST